MRWLLEPSWRTWDKVDSASCQKVWSFPFSFWTRLIPSMMVADSSGMSSAGETFFSNSLARAALLALRSDPSSLASAQGKGPSGRAKTSLICRFLLSAVMTIWPNSLLSAFRTTSLARPWLRGFFLMSENVFSLIFVIFSWKCTDGATLASALAGTFGMLPPLSCRLQEGPWPLLVVPRHQLTSWRALHARNWTGSTNWSPSAERGTTHQPHLFSSLAAVGLDGWSQCHVGLSCSSVASDIYCSTRMSDSTLPQLHLSGWNLWCLLVSLLTVSSMAWSTGICPNGFWLPIWTANPPCMTWACISWCLLSPVIPRKENAVTCA